MKTTMQLSAINSKEISNSHNYLVRKKTLKHLGYISTFFKQLRFYNFHVSCNINKKWEPYIKQLKTESKYLHFTKQFVCS